LIGEALKLLAGRAPPMMNSIHQFVDSAILGFSLLILAKCGRPPGVEARGDSEQHDARPKEHGQR
jgi:hypothetical protein